MGQTRQKLSKRWGQHKGASKKVEQPLYFAIRKHSLENFTCGSILQVETQAEADYQERMWIILLRAHVSQDGYVCSWGGDGRIGLCPESRWKKLHTRARTLRQEPERFSNYRLDISDEDISRLYLKEEMSHESIAKALGCSQYMVSYRLRKMGTKVERPPKIKVGKESKEYIHELDVSEMIRLYIEEKLPLKKIAPIVGCSWKTVSNRLTEEGIILRPTNSGTKREDLSTEEMISMYDSGLTLRQISEKMGCASTSVKQRLKKSGVILRPSNNVPRNK